MKLTSIFPLLFAALILSSCTSFEKEWEAAVDDYQSGAVKSPEGPWTGEWTTSTNGHTGDLRAIVKESSKKPGHYDFRYHATWANVFSGTYKVTYPVSPSGSGFTVNGDQKLGIFGTFHHEGTIRGNSFNATYSNEKGDLGDFRLRRP